ncbi:hypothetical protein Ddc_24709 [Ditylenchus destructor]|nr:hypothetical protein Ddc_24709 [Ditylenchus destructor]
MLAEHQAVEVTGDGLATRLQHGDGGLDRAMVSERTGTRELRGGRWGDPHTQVSCQLRIRHGVRLSRCCIGVFRDARGFRSDDRESPAVRMTTSGRNDTRIPIPPKCWAPCAVWCRATRRRC